MGFGTYGKGVKTMETKKLSAEHQLKLICSDCKAQFNEWGQSRCVGCGHRYKPTLENANCPGCSNDEYDEMCPKCHDGILSYAEEADRLTGETMKNEKLGRN